MIFIMFQMSNIYKNINKIDSSIDVVPLITNFVVLTVMSHLFIYLSVRLSFHIYVFLSVCLAARFLVVCGQIDKKRERMEKKE